jgi:hypothetical protein
VIPSRSMRIYRIVYKTRHGDAFGDACNTGVCAPTCNPPTMDESHLEHACTTV